MLPRASVVEAKGECHASRCNLCPPGDRPSCNRGLGSSRRSLTLWCRAAPRQRTRRILDDGCETRTSDDHSAEHGPAAALPRWRLWPRRWRLWRWLWSRRVQPRLWQRPALWGWSAASAAGVVLWLRRRPLPPVVATQVDHDPGIVARAMLASDRNCRGEQLARERRTALLVAAHEMVHQRLPVGIDAELRLVPESGQAARRGLQRRGHDQGGIVSTCPGLMRFGLLPMTALFAA